MNSSTKEKIPHKVDERQSLPVLYSLRNCPYAMRARMAIFKTKQIIQLRDIVLSNKPSEMIAASTKATVPVLVLADGSVIDESLAIMLWALQQSDPNDLLHQKSHNTANNKNTLTAMLVLIAEFDTDFKSCLEQYKCAKRYQEDNVVECRIACEQYLQRLEQRLTQHPFLMSDKESLTDIALMPFIRQFARVERQWYLQSPYPKVRQWLNNYLQSPMFTKVMAKYPLWLDNHEVVLFGDKQH
ncbi:glutathione S-transferase [Colwellia asteriadis]|uniref:Glutathione S-transferase n=1 Tax=Colwellia asteriadis TaxID=517723 RepID=A0ABN1LA10_9GAMM